MLMRYAIVGAGGLVGRELSTLLKDQDPILFGSDSTPSYEGIDVAFFCVSSEVAKEEIPKAVKKNVLCIDASTAFRDDPSVPLIIPEINGHIMEQANGIISSPNCTTTLMLLPLAPIHRAFSIKRIIATTYQAVSGAGYRGMTELQAQIQGQEHSEIFPKPCANNVYLHESPLQSSGYVEEEEKMHIETQKILEDSNIQVSARCVRVPVFRAHCIALNVELEKSFELFEIESLLAEAPGATYQDGASALDATGICDVLCGNLRIDKTQANTLELWVCGDQLLKGAALNMFQIANALCLN